MKRAAFAVVAICAITVATSGAAFADTPEPAPLDVCDGNAQVGSWGHHVKWQRHYQLPNCRKTQISYGEADVANKTVGFKYWETSS